MCIKNIDSHLSAFMKMRIRCHSFTRNRQLMCRKGFDQSYRLYVKATSGSRRASGQWWNWWRSWRLADECRLFRRISVKVKWDIRGIRWSGTIREWLRYWRSWIVMICQRWLQMWHVFVKPCFNGTISKVFFGEGMIWDVPDTIPLRCGIVSKLNTLSFRCRRR